VYPAAVTPYDAKGQVDLAAVARLMAWFKSNGCTGVVLAGTNGEGPSLSAVEKRDLVKAAAGLSDGLEVVLGIATASLDEAKWLCRQAHSAGAAATLVMPPSYFKDVTANAIASWFEALMDSSPIPILVYNFPSRTGITLSAETMGRLAKHPQMLGLKDSSGNRDNISEYADAVSGAGKLMYVGDETLLASALTHGWTGTISGAANLLPGWLSQIVAEWDVNQESAETKFALIEPTLQLIRKCPQPASNKAMLKELGILPSADLRLPLEPVSAERYEVALNSVRSLVR
jgi:4-hydroxy-tetrahydrodipicolinate synthase